MCLKLFSNDKTNVNSYPILIQKHGGILVDICKSSALSTTNTANKEQLLQIGQSIENASVKILTELKAPASAKDPAGLMDASKDLLDALEKFLAKERPASSKEKKEFFHSRGYQNYVPGLVFITVTCLTLLILCVK